MIELRNSKDIINLITQYRFKNNGSDQANLLLFACQYVLSQFTNDELIYGKIVSNVYLLAGSPQKEKESVKRFIAAFYCILASYKTIYSLPNMMDCGLNPGGVSAHRLYGESVSQLVSVILVGEGYHILNGIPTSQKIDLFQYLNKEIFTFRRQSQIIQNIKEIKKSDIRDDYNAMKKVFLRNILEGSILLCGLRGDTSENYEELFDTWQSSATDITDQTLQQGIRSFLTCN